MEQLIKHLINNNLDEIVEKSILDCHSKGLHSIMLLDSPGKTIRLYISTPDSDMYRNLPENIGFKNISLGFHAHHCNLTLYCVKGSFTNWQVEKSSDPNSSLLLDKYLYSSKITNDELKFTLEAKSQFLNTESIRTVKEGGCISLKASDIHTVGCRGGDYNAWLVFEGKEDPDYKPFLWTDNDPNRKDHTGLYNKPSRAGILFLLQIINLIE